MKKPPLPNWMLLFGLIGLIISTILALNSQLPTPWTFTFTLFFLIVTIASFVSLR